jgi:hypothetical protein
MTDEEAVRPHKIISKVPDIECDGTYICTLDCGHVCWFAIEPSVEELVCALCIHNMLDRRQEKDND